jgi:hypothetical protein
MKGGGLLALGLLAAACSAERGKPWLDGGEDPSNAYDEPDGGAAMPRDGLDGGGESGQGGRGADGGNDKNRPGELCGDFPIPAYNQVPELLLVLDRSGSMRDLTVDRWGPSVMAVESITAALQTNIHFGLMTFPGDCLTLPQAEQLACLARLGGLDQTLSCEPGRVDVPVALHNAAAISEQLKKTTPSGATPTAASILSATQALNDLPAHAGQGTKSILLVTDGAPNCSLGVGGLLAVGVNTGSGQSEAVQQTVDAVRKANQAGVRTYVIGYQTQADPFLRGSLDQMASVGGTGENQHLPVEDQATLVHMLDQLAQQVLLCQLRLDQPVTDLSRLRVTLSGQPVAQDPVNGFSLGADLRTVALHGSSCDVLRASNGAATGRAQLLCPPVEPPAVPEMPDQLPDGGALDAGSEGPISI